MENISKIEALTNQINFIKGKVNKELFRKAQYLQEKDEILILSQGKDYFELDVLENKVSVEINTDENKSYIFSTKCTCKSNNICSHNIASLLFLKDNFLEEELNKLPSGKQYTREGMIKRVMQERQKKALSETFNLKLSKNIFGEHKIKNERNITYSLTFRNIENKIGYCTCPDYNKNKLGTCKHLIFAFSEFKKFPKTAFKATNYPFIEVYLDPFDKQSIRYFYPHNLDAETQTLFNYYFDKNNTYYKEDKSEFLQFIRQANNNESILIRKEVFDLIEETYDNIIIQQLKESTKIDLSKIKATLYPYQKEGVAFAAYKKGAIIADEMGLGKTLQAISIAIVKKQLFSFEKCLIICPASLKEQWKNEIKKFSDEKATVVYGFPEQREETYLNDTNFFHIINYETVLRDKDAINKANYDFIILDEAQRIKNYETITANAVKVLHKKHGLVITGTPIENKLIDLYSIVEFLDKKLLTPMWEFSYQYCIFDTTHKNKITGYTNLQELKNKIAPLLIRRTKKEVINQLHNLTEITIPVEMHPKQQELHASYAKGVASILHKKFKTSYDWQKLTMLLQSMRMVCNSTFLIDPNTNFSPKLSELKEVLFDKLDIKNNQRKIIIFSEWLKTHKIISEVLKENNIGFTQLSGKIPVKKRQALINEFENNENCRIFLSTEAGGAGLNLQMADTVINFELPWNPAKKNQRIGRIDRLGQKHQNLTVINFITKNSIEMKIATGLLAKQELFDSVLNSDSNLKTVDFSDKGRAQFLQELELSMQEFTQESCTEILTETDGLEQELLDVNKENNQEKTISETQKQENEKRIKKLEEMENVMNKGMEFLAGMFKMATGNELKTDNNKIEINKETGEVVMRFKVQL